MHIIAFWLDHQFYCMIPWKIKSNKATKHCARPSCLTTLNRSIFYKADPSFVESYASKLGANIEWFNILRLSIIVSLQVLNCRPKSQTIPNSPRPVSSARAFWALTQLRAFSLPWAQWAQLVLLVADSYQLTISKIRQNTSKVTEKKESANLSHLGLTSSLNSVLSRPCVESTWNTTKKPLWPRLREELNDFCRSFGWEGLVNSTWRRNNISSFLCSFVFNLYKQLNRYKYKHMT